MGIISLAFFYVGSFGDVPGLYDWLTRSFPSAFFQSAFLLGALAVLLVGRAFAEPAKQISGGEEN